MKFNRLIFRVASFWTAFTLSIIVASLFSDATHCTSSYNPQTDKMSKIRPAGEIISDVSTDDYAVFSAVMQQRLSFRMTYVIGDAAFDETPENALKIDRESFHLSEETLNNYVYRNSEARLLQDQFELKSRLPVVLLSDQQEADFFAKNEAGWDNFFESYPNSGGIIYFSNVGFNREKTEAMVRIKYLCALCSGKENFYFLTKRGDDWRVR